MKEFILFLFGFFCVRTCSAQDMSGSVIDSIVHVVDLSKEKSVKNFSAKKKIARDKTIVEKWEHKKTGEKSYFSISYKIDSTEFFEEYYTYKGKLIFSSEREVSYYPSSGPESYIVWAGHYYFSGNKMFDYETLGHGKSESDDWDPEKETLKKFQQRNKQLKSSMSKWEKVQ